MFDPTAFDNVKVVLEGALYEADLEGSIAVINRQDLVDLARMSREYRITFQLSHVKGVNVELTLSSTLSMLSSELLMLSNQQSGANLKLTYRIDEKTELGAKLERILKRCWGNRLFEKIEYRSSESGKKLFYKHVFNRPILEDQVDDLIALSEKSIQSLEMLI
ncbi:hypothetical protein WAK64_09425 [Bacillus spongiae]|uniref:Uncharacterized protein n=2 Tax=Bacillus spongiae TaxID=2683610 RepID=A0ABU8HDB3_9BACI